MLLCIYICSSFSADLTILGTSADLSTFVKQVDFICRFYGLSIERLFLGKNQNNNFIIDSLKSSESRAIIITANALAYIDSLDVFSALLEIHKTKIPFFFYGLTSTTDAEFLKKLSGGAVLGCTSESNIQFNGFFNITDCKNIAWELSGQKIPFTCKRIHYLILNKTKEPQQILEIMNKKYKMVFPIFVKTVVNECDIFFMTEVQSFDSSDELAWHYESNRFFEIAPLLFFLRFCCRERCWHSLYDYANLTIDDPWLTEPYGHLSYEGLLGEMEKKNFHTTIAFIPWNFDRSKAEVISMFKNHPRRFSICIHGNNHDHREFCKYETKPNSILSERFFDAQEVNIKQALARMEKFKDLTGIPYDKVMVFPHGIGPARTLGLLKKYNFLATVNAGNVPLDSIEPEDPFFRLRPVTLQFENFPSLNRYTPKRTKIDIAIDLFLDNPILFYVHHDFFRKGIDVFNETATMLNNIKPNIHWKSLGYIVKHLYLERQRNSKEYEVLAFSSNFVLENVHQCDLAYFVRKEESFLHPIKQITVDGQPCTYKRSKSELMLELKIPAGRSRHIIIEYENNLDISSIDISKADSRINRLRIISDFRDMTLSKSVIGTVIIRFYYDTGLYKLGIMRLAIVFFILVILITLGIFYFARFRKRKKI